MATVALCEVFPLNPLNKPAIITPFTTRDDIPVECIQRQIDNGEHKFDADGNIIYGPFPTCSETGKPLSFHYGTNEDFNCTVVLTDEVYHMFQLYVHEDSPFSCRVPHSSTYKDANVPFTLNFRGHLETSHLDIDTTMNVIAHKGPQSTVMTMVGYASGSHTQRYIIGDLLTIRFSVNWIDEFHTADKTFFKLSSGWGNNMLWTVSAVSAFISGLMVYAVLYGRVNKKFVKELGYSPGGFTQELGLDKKD